MYTHTHTTHTHTHINTHKHTTNNKNEKIVTKLIYIYIYIYITYKILAGVPGIAQDYQSRNLMYGVIFGYKEKERHNSDGESMSTRRCWREYWSVRRNLL
jgi:hypothetical protein